MKSNKKINQQNNLKIITGDQMSLSVLYMSMSLDGFIAGPNDNHGNPGGDGFMHL